MISIIAIALVLGFVVWVAIDGVTGRGCAAIPIIVLTVSALLLAFLLFVAISVATGGNSLVTVGS